MPSIGGTIRTYRPYAFMVVGAAWVAIAFIVGSVLVLWPAVACFVGGALLWGWASTRLTWAWATSTALFGFLLSAYQSYVAANFVSGSFSTIAVESLIGFGAFAVVHLVLFYAARASATRPT